MSNSHRQRKRKAPASSLAPTTIRDEQIDDGLSSIPHTATYKTGGDGKLKNIPAPRSRRGKFTPEQRKETARTRELGACETCRARKVRCTHASQADDTQIEASATPKVDINPHLFGVWATPFEDKQLNFLEEDGLDIASARLAISPATARQDELGGLINSIDAALAAQPAQNVLQQPVYCSAYDTQHGVPNMQLWNRQDMPWSPLLPIDENGEETSTSRLSPQVRRTASRSATSVWQRYHNGSIQKLTQSQHSRKRIRSNSVESMTGRFRGLNIGPNKARPTATNRPVCYQAELSFAMPAAQDMGRMDVMGGMTFDNEFLQEYTNLSVDPSTLSMASTQPQITFGGTLRDRTRYPVLQDGSVHSVMAQTQCDWSMMPNPFMTQPPLSFNHERDYQEIPIPQPPSLNHKHSYGGLCSRLNMKDSQQQGFACLSPSTFAEDLTFPFMLNTNHFRTHIESQSMPTNSHDMGNHYLLNNGSLPTFAAPLQRSRAPSITVNDKAVDETNQSARPNQFQQNIAPIAIPTRLSSQPSVPTLSFSTSLGSSGANGSVPSQAGPLNPQYFNLMGGSTDADDACFLSCHNGDGVAPTPIEVEQSQSYFFKGNTTSHPIDLDNPQPTNEFDDMDFFTFVE